MIRYTATWSAALDYHVRDNWTGLPLYQDISTMSEARQIANALNG